MRDALNEYFGNMIDMLSGHGADIVKFAGKASPLPLLRLSPPESFG